MEDHVPRHAQMGAWVLINDRWYEASLDAFSDTPFLSPALDLADLGGFLVMCTLLRQADRAAR